MSNHDTYEILTEPVEGLEVHKIMGWGARSIQPTKKLANRVEDLHTMRFETLMHWCLLNVEAIKKASPESISDLSSFRARGSSPWRVHHGLAGTPIARGLVLASSERHNDPMDRIEEQTFTGPRNRWSHLSARTDPPPRSVVALSMFLGVAPQELRPVLVVWWSPPPPKK